MQSYPSDVYVTYDIHDPRLTDRNNFSRDVCPVLSYEVEFPLGRLQTIGKYGERKYWDEYSGSATRPRVCHGYKFQPLDARRMRVKKKYARDRLFGYLPKTPNCERNLVKMKLDTRKDLSPLRMEKEYPPRFLHIYSERLRLHHRRNGDRITSIAGFALDRELGRAALGETRENVLEKGYL